MSLPYWRSSVTQIERATATEVNSALGEKHHVVVGNVYQRKYRWTFMVVLEATRHDRALTGSIFQGPNIDSFQVFQDPNIPNFSRFAMQKYVVLIKWWGGCSYS